MVSFSTALSVGATVFQGVSALSAGRSNSRALAGDAASQRERTKLELERQRRENRRIRGEQVVGFVNAGVSSRSGSALDILADSMAEAELDLRLIEKGGSLAENRALSEARMQRRTGRDQFTGGLLAGVGELAGDFGL